MNKVFVLDVSQNPMEKDKLIIYPSNNSANQKFYLRSVGNGKYGMFCSQNDNTIEVRGNQKGAKIFAGQPNKQ
jgi:hypothetical protein